jgi:hypothetical protein
MTKPVTAPPETPHSPKAAPPALSPTRRLASRIVAALIMGLILLALSGVIHTAAAARLGGGWSYLWMTWLVVVLAVLAVALGSPTPRHAWSRLCLINAAAAGIAFSLCVITGPALRAIAGDRSEPFAWPGEPYPPGPAFGVALLSGVVGIASAILAIVLVGLFYLLRQHKQPR